MQRTHLALAYVFLSSTVLAGALLAQAPGTAPGFVAYPPRPVTDPAAVERGREMYVVNCAFCHGEDARGGDTGPNLRRTQAVLDDQDGELIGPVVLEGRLDRGMPKFAFNPAQVKDVATFLHSLSVNPRGETAPINIVVGNAALGETFFKTRCSSCHSATGDLRGVATRYPDPKTLQQTWIMPGTGGNRAGGPGRAAPRPTVTVTLPSGERVNGALDRLDNFWVSVRMADGSIRGFRTTEDTPKVEVHNPLEGHRQLLPLYADGDIHNVTAYLVTLK